MEITFGVLGGLGLFLYGMHVMSSGLQKVAGSKLKDIISMLTANRVMGVAVGAVVTAIVQSSSATTVMVVGFVNAGMMQLTQAASLIMGPTLVPPLRRKSSVLKLINMHLSSSVLLWGSGSLPKIENKTDG